MFRVRTITEIGRHLIGIVDASYDDRLVWVTFFECDNYLLPDPRPEETPQRFPAHI